MCSFYVIDVATLFYKFSQTYDNLTFTNSFFHAKATPYFHLQRKTEIHEFL